MIRRASCSIALATVVGCIATSGCSLSGTYLQDLNEVRANHTAIGAAGLRLAPHRGRRIGFDAGIRAYHADSVATAAHGNILISIYEDFYGFSGIGYGGSFADRSWEIGLGAQTDVSTTATGPLAVFAELGWAEVYRETGDPSLPAEIPLYGAFVRVGVSWCFTMRVEC